MLTLFNRQSEPEPMDPPVDLLQVVPVSAPPPPPPPMAPPVSTRPRFDLRVAEAQAEGYRRKYTLSRTVLGDFALHWAEPWWGGLFSVVDIATYLPGSRFFHPTDNHETVYSGDASAFNSTPWEWAGKPYGHSYDVYTGDTPPSPFSENPLMPYAGTVPMSEVLVGEHVDDHQSDEVRRWKTQRRRLPFWRRQLALPAPVQNVPDFNDNRM